MLCSDAFKAFFTGRSLLDDLIINDLLFGFSKLVDLLFDLSLRSL